MVVCWAVADVCGVGMWLGVVSVVLVCFGRGVGFGCVVLVVVRCFV